MWSRLLGRSTVSHAAAGWTVGVFTGSEDKNISSQKIGRQVRPDLNTTTLGRAPVKRPRADISLKTIKEHVEILLSSVSSGRGLGSSVKANNGKKALKM